MNSPISFFACFNRVLTPGRLGRKPTLVHPAILPNPLPLDYSDEYQKRLFSMDGQRSLQRSHDIIFVMAIAGWLAAGILLFMLIFVVGCQTETARNFPGRLRGPEVSDSPVRESAAVRAVFAKPVPEKL